MGTTIIRAAFVAALALIFGCDAGDGKRTTIHPNNAALQGGDCHDASGNVERCDVGEVCRAGRCIPAGGCLNNSECADDQTCDPNTNLCIELQCADRDACTLGEARDHRCVLVPTQNCCLNDSTCGDDQFCGGNMCMPVSCDDDPDDCFDSVVRGHECVSEPIVGCCVNNEDCAAAAPFCDMQDNTCIECVQHGDCAANEACIAGACAPVECDLAPDPCTTAAINPQTRECIEDRTAVPECCLADAECGEGFCPSPGEACIQCRNDADCADSESCTDGTCTAIICTPTDACDVTAPADHGCSHERRPGCCLNDNGCQAGVCENNTCVECRESSDCAANMVCDLAINACVAAQCQPSEGCTQYVFNNNTRQCDPTPVPGCCEGPADDAACRAPCAGNADCSANEECRAYRGNFFCVPSNLPAGYTVGCELDAVEGSANRCTTCRELDQDGTCARFELCGNGIDDDGDGTTDEGVLNPANVEPNPEIHCTQCNVNADCAAGMECNLLNGRCAPPAECRVDVDCQAGQSCINGSCAPVAECTESSDCAAGQVCDTGACRPAVCPTDFVCAGGQVCQNGACVVNPPPPVNGDSDGDGVAACIPGVNAPGCDCDDDVSDVMAPAAMCRKANNALVIYINFRANGEANRPTCRAGEVAVRATDGSVLNGPMQPRDTPSDGFDNDCDQQLDEGGADVCTWTSIQDGTNVVGVPGQIWEASCPWFTPPPAR